MPSRRQLLVGTGAIGIATLAGCTAFADREPDLTGDWPQLGRDRTNRNYAPEMTLPGDLEESWRVSVGSWPYTPPVVADGSVFVAGSRGVFALDAPDGTERWRRDIDGDVGAALAVVDGALLVPEHRREGTDRLRAFDLGDGADRWAVALESRPFAPSVADGRVYLRTRDACLAVADGELSWRTELDRLVYDRYNVRDTQDFTSLIAPAVTPDGVVVPDRDAVVALDPDDGTERWRVDLRGSMASPVAVDDGILAAGLDEVVAVERDGSERWRSEHGGWGTVASADADAYVAGGGTLTSLTLDEGERAWGVSTSGDVQRSQPAIVGDAALTVNNGGIAVRREDPGWLGDRELFRIGGDATHVADHGGVAVGGGRVLVVDGIRGDAVGLEPAG